MKNSKLLAGLRRAAFLALALFAAPLARADIVAGEGWSRATPL
jgi:hypothetical protein